METNRCHFPRLVLEGRDKEQTRGWVCFFLSPSKRTHQQIQRPDQILEFLATDALIRSERRGGGGGSL